MNKEQYHKKGKKILKELANKLGLPENSFEIRSQKGGPAVLGEIILHSDSLYIMIGGLNEDSVLYRSCNGRKDYCGGQNNYLVLKDIFSNGALETFKNIGNI